jgi:hypothetical protein
MFLLYQKNWHLLAFGLLTHKPFSFYLKCAKIPLQGLKLWVPYPSSPPKLKIGSRNPKWGRREAPRQARGVRASVGVLFKKSYNFNQKIPHCAGENELKFCNNFTKWSITAKISTTVV